MNLPNVPVWKESPFIRLLLPFVAGIAGQYFIGIPPGIPLTLIGACIVGVACISQQKLSFRFSYAPINGLFINILLISLGASLTHFKDTAGKAKEVDAWCRGPSIIVANLQEPVSVQVNFYKAVCIIRSVRTKDTCIDPGTGMIIYFRRDSSVLPLEYGDRVAFTKSPERIKNMGGPNGFDYVQYCARQNIYFQTFLRAHEYVKLDGREKNVLNSFLFKVRTWVIGLLHNNIPGKKESGLAEALLIGYRDDLDKQLIQAYSKTGVVHVVAISGLHLALIYGLLKLLCSAWKGNRLGKLFSPLIILAGLWLFSLLAGGSPSVVRSAVMFSFIVLGESINRKTPVINNLASSAFFLLCYNPFWLWDIGFQLSYTALLSIVVFMKPIYHLYLTNNKMLDALWQLNAVTLSAQILTLPVCLYYFHQFPTLFLVANCLAIPLSSIILMGEIALCAVSFLKALANPLGWVLSRLLMIMNKGVEMIGNHPFSTVTALGINFRQVVFMYIFIAATAIWLMKKRRSGLVVALIAGILFMAVRLI